MGEMVHVVPVADVVEHDTTGVSCVCGPVVELVSGVSGDGWLVTHHSLDGRERSEADGDTARR